MPEDQPATTLRRELGLAAVAAVVIGNTLGSGIFFTPGELAPIATASWQVYFFWGLCGLITLCGALTLAELSSRLPRAGAVYHILDAGFGPFWAFLFVWMQLWVAGPGSVAGVAIAFGEFLSRFLGGPVRLAAPAWGALAIAFFAIVNLCGIRWGGRTQVALTVVKVLGLLGLVGGSLLLAVPAPASETAAGGESLMSFVRLIGLGIGVVLFTYDGWIDVSHVAGEVDRPRRNLPLGLGLGVAAVTLLYLTVNFAYLRVVPLEAMRETPTTVAASVSEAAFGPSGAPLLNALLVVSIFGALGGLVMTLPRLFFAAAAQYADMPGIGRVRFFQALSSVSPGSMVPVGAILFCAAMSTTALLFFGTLSRIVNFFVVPMQLGNVLMVAAVFRLRAHEPPGPGEYRTPGYPVVPLVYIVVMGLFMLSAIVYRPLDTLAGVALAATGIPVYAWLARRRS